jgi:hypothetical protein
MDDAAGRKAVRERRRPLAGGASVFVPVPPASGAAPVLVLRDDVHERGLIAARKILRTHRASEPKPSDE